MRRIESAGDVNLSWPHLQATAHSPIRSALARRIFLASVRGLKLSVIMPAGEVFGDGRGGFADGGDPTLRVVNPDGFFSRLGRDGALGFGEAYLVGDWTTGDSAGSACDSDELAAWLETYAVSLRDKESRWLFRLRSLWHRSLPVSEPNSADGARRNVQAHYDITPELFELFLDPSMTYSCALFESGCDLSSAQQRKIDAILDLAQVDSGTHLLDIGFGFGELAVRAARERCARVTGITLSEEQRKYAAGRVGRLNLGDRISFHLEDYRQHSGRYTAISCVEMIEAVGSDYWAGFFAKVDSLLAPGGHFALQVITFPHEKMLASTRDFSWVDRYIFPGGALPSLREIDHILKRQTALEVAQARRLTDSYALTLRLWRHKFLAARQAVKALGFDETFIRLWTLYFAYFEAAFRARYCDVWQLGIRKI
jgi:cyclopropane-fatty-acyl-phospholipid synthase